jgi:nucleoside phosphorylase
MRSALSDEDIDTVAEELLKQAPREVSLERVAADMFITLKDERKQLTDRLVITKERCKQKLAAQAAKAEAEFNAMTVEMRAANVARVIEESGNDFVALANRCERIQKERDDLREAIKIYKSKQGGLQNELFGSPSGTGPQRVDGEAPRHDD